MEKNKKGPKRTIDPNNENFFSDEITKKKIDRHLSDINDTISDDDIRNVITDIKSEPSADINDAKVTDDNLGDDTKDNSLEEAKQLPTSWNIID